MACADANGMGYAWALLLGLLQGLTEFLPISSSGHLALAGHLLGHGRPQSVAFDLLLHLATVLVVLLAFWRDLARYWRSERTVIGLLVLGTIPAGIVGLLLRDEFEALRESPSLVCLALLVTAALLLAADRWSGKGGEPVPLRRLGGTASLAVGLCQALAIVPGISRSGATIAGGVLCGLEREEAVKFSFLLMVPAVLGACLLEVLDKPEAVRSLPPGPGLLAFGVALVSGYGALRLLLVLVRRRRLSWFAGYCLLVAAAGLVYFNLPR